MRRRTFFMMGAAAPMALVTLAAQEATASQQKSQDGWRELTAPGPSPLLTAAREHPERYGRYWSHLEVILADHFCTCFGCVPELGDALHRSGPNHYGLRFFNKGDVHYSDNDLMDRYAQVMVNGQRVISTTEVVTGNPGTVWMYRGVRDENTTTGKEILNAGFRHACATCRVRSADANLGRDNIAYKLEWSEHSQKMIPVRITPRWGACFTKLTLPNVTAFLMPGARVGFEAEQARREARWNAGLET